MKLTIDGREYDTIYLDSVSRYCVTIAPRFFRRFPEKSSFEAICLSVTALESVQVVRASFSRGLTYEITNVFSSQQIQEWMKENSMVEYQ